MPTDSFGSGHYKKRSMRERRRKAKQALKRKGIPFADTMTTQELERLEYGL